MMKITPLFFLLTVCLFSCSDKEIDIYGAKNTVTVNFPDGTQVYHIKLQTGEINDPYPYGSAFVPSSILPHLHIVDYKEDMWIDIKRDGIPRGIGKINQNHLQHDYSHFRFIHNGEYYYNHLHNPSDYLDIDDLRLGKSINTSVPNFITFNELVSVKAKFEINMSHASNSPQFPEDIPVSGTIHISRD